ncbi:MAG: alkaline phosphatase family protein [Xanthomonadales bacterium]|nr:alkaline phosphatase family protein [Xanthomonadales bacterium]
MDQLRGDMPTRYADRFGDGGFRYLIENGVHYTSAHYQHANTETIVGHASLATGALPSMHGMVANVWFDHGLQRLVYNIEDPDYTLLTANAGVDKATEIDPTQKAAGVTGRSPNAILVSTLGDEMAIHFGGKAKIFGVSVKDRSAVAMAGHAGKAFWFSKSSGEFVTSNYYYDEYPDWVTRWNQADHVSAYAGRSWNLLHEKSSYLFGDSDDRPWETDFPGFGRTFPHAFGAADDKYFTTRLTLSPAGDRLTLNFARELIRQEKLGQDAVPDYLSVSFSATDYVGHLFGASSLEAEDNILQLDRTLAELFAFIEQEIGLENTMIVLSADHGGPESPGYLNSLGIRNAQYFDTENLDREPAIARLKQKFGIGKELITMYSHPYVYLNRELIREKGLDQAAVEQAVAEELAEFGGISVAVPSSALAENRQPDTLLMRSVLNNYNAKRSGDIFVVFEPNVFINDFDGLVVAATHGSPWRYDTHVPIFFAGPRIGKKTIHRTVAPYDIAPTLAASLRMKPPSGAFGQPLVEVLSN